MKELALEKGIPVWQPTKLRDGSALEILRQLAPELIVVMAYGRILPKDILDCPPLGCVNIHGSLLPKYRGAAPIQWSVLNGDPVAGVTSMYMARRDGHRRYDPHCGDPGGRERNQRRAF